MMTKKEYLFASVPLLAAILTSFILGSRFPTWGELVIFWIVPSFFAAAVLTLLLVRLRRFTADEALSYAVRVVGGGAVAAVFLSLFQAWNDGSFFQVLPPTATLGTFFTLGVIPFHEGPMLFLRLLPLTIGVGCLLALWQRGERGRRLWLWGFVAYAGVFVMVHAMSWVALILSWSRHTDLTNASDTFRLLTSAQADGYWLRLQAERFLFPVGQQAEYAISAVHAALFAIVGMVCVACALPRFFVLPSPRLPFLRVLGTACAGYLVFSVTQFPQVSYTNIIALILATAVLILFALFRFAALPDGTRRHVYLGPLLFGGAVLGYPILMSLVVAAVALSLERTFSCHPRERGDLEAAGQDSRFHGNDTVRKIVTSFALLWLSNLALVWAAALFVSRDVMLPGWLIRFIFALTFLATWGEMWSRFQTVFSSSWCSAIAVMLSSLVLLLLRQTLAWILFVPILLACGLAWRFPARSPRILCFLPDAFLLIFALLPILAPNLLHHV